MKKDVIDGYMQETLQLKDDYEGKVEVVLVSKKASAKTDKAVLYIHGFADYFFNGELGDFFNKCGYDFYALDLRKYGRSLLPHQHPNFCKDLSEYFEEIDEAINIIRNRDGHSKLILNGHSTGGLTSSLYAHERRNDNLIDGLLLNSPWFDMNESWFVKNFVIKLFAFVGKFSPFSMAPKGLDKNYPLSVHKDYCIDKKNEYGVYEESCWEFNTDWKSVGEFPVFNGFIRAIRNGHKKVQKGLDIKCPIFLLSSDKRGKVTKNVEAHYFDSDCVLNPAHMRKYIDGLGSDISQHIIKNGMHDLSLSQKNVREEFYSEVSKWLKEKF